MTLKYALTRAEIAKFFLLGLRRSPKFLVTILVYSLLPGTISVVNGAFSRPLTSGDFAVFFEWTLFTLCILPAGIYVRGKTDERTLTVADEGITTVIGSLKGKIPWNQVRLISDVGEYVLIARTSGNAFFIPNRAFSGPKMRRQFIDEAERLRRAA